MSGVGILFRRWIDGRCFRNEDPDSAFFEPHLSCDHHSGYFWFLLKPYLKRDYSQIDLVSDLGWVTLILFLFATPWLMSWYPSVLLPFAALGLESPVLALTSLTFSLCAGLIVGTGGRQSLISIVTTLVTLLPPIAILVSRAKLLRKLSQMISQA